MTTADAGELLAEYLRLNPEATPAEAVGAVGADPSVWISVVEDALASDTPEDVVRNAETTRLEADPEDETPTPDAGKTTEQDGESDDGDEFNQQTTTEDAGVLVNSEVDYSTVESDTYPPELMEREQWMGRRGKLPFAPWGDAEPEDADPDDSPRYEWGRTENYVDGDTVAVAEDDPRLDGRVFLQRDGDPYAFVDGDDVRCPDTGEVHPAFAAILQHLGTTYADVSTSGAGVHAYYRAEDGLPIDGKGQATFEIDTEPWGENDSPPTVEVYANKHVCVTTGDHVEGTPLDLAEWDADALRSVLQANGYTDKEPVSHDTDRERPELDGYDPEATTSDEQAGDIRDVLHAVDRLRSYDLPLRTRQTGEDSTGWRTWDPSYRSSESGESLHSPPDEPVFHDHKEGESFGLLGLYAAEQGIISNPWDRLDGSEWWEAVDAAREDGAPIPEYNPTEEREPVAPIALKKLDALAPEERKRAARRRGLEIPSTSDARSRLRDAVFREIRAGNTTVLDAPTALGKSYTVATEPWVRRESVTGGVPVIHLHPTREARDDAASETRDSMATGAVLRGRKEASPVARGDHDPAEEPEDESPDVVVTIDGQPASEWFDYMCDEKGLPFSTALALARERNDQQLDELPPFGEEDPAVAQWDGLPREEDGSPAVDVVHATHQFAHVPSIRTNTNVVLDEQPDFSLELSQDRIRRMVNAYLEEIGAPATNFEAFVMLAESESTGTDASKERDALDSMLDTNTEVRTEWYVEDPDAHALAPALTRAIWNALQWEEPDRNGRRSTKVHHEPPRLNTDESGYNAGTWLSVVINDDHTIHTARATPDFRQARAVIGLDAHPSMPLWELNAAPGMTRDAVLDPTERRLWRRYERGLTVVQVGDAARPRSGDTALDWMNTDRVREILKTLREHYGPGFKTALSTIQTEHQLRELLGEFVPDVDAENTMHYGEEKSRNDYATEDAGYVYGCMDPGDDMILDALAELNLDAAPATVETEDGEVKREKGRTFDGDDAEKARAVLASVRENHVAQAAGRYARNAEDDESRATVYVDTNAAPAGFVDIEAPGVEWLATDLQREIIGELRTRVDATAKALADTVECTKEHVRKTLRRLEDAELVTRRESSGENGADVYREAGADTSLVDLGETTNNALKDTNRWSLAVRERHTDIHAESTPPESRLGVDNHVTGGDAPPDPAD